MVGAETEAAVWWQWGLSRNHWHKRIMPATPSSFEKTLLDALLFASLWPCGGHDLTPPPAPSNLRNPGKEDAEDNDQSPCSVWPELKVESKNMSYYRTPIVAVSIVIWGSLLQIYPKRNSWNCARLWIAGKTQRHSWSGMWSRLTCSGSELELLTIWEWEASVLGFSRLELLLAAEMWDSLLLLP